MESLFSGRAFRLEKHGDVGVLIFDLEGERVNKLAHLSVGELDELTTQIQQKGSAWGMKAILLKSAKKGSFIVGADITLIQGMKDAGEAKKASEEGQRVFSKMKKLGIPVIAAIDGPCAGGGTELSLACEYRVCSDSDKTAISLPEVKLGFLPGWGGTYRLPKLVGLATSLDMMLTGKSIRADKAGKIGLVDQVIPQGLFEEKAMEFAKDVAAGKFKRKERKVNLQETLLEGNFVGRKVIFSKAREGVMKQTGGHYPAPLKIIDVLESQWGNSEISWLAKEANEFSQLWATPVSKNLVSLFFMVENGKKDSGTQLSVDEIKALAPIQSVGVLGAGVMGGGIASQTAASQMRTFMKDLQWDAISKGLAHAQKLFDDDLKKRRISKYEKSNRMNRVRGQVDYSGFQHLDLVIEAVVEDLNVKKKVFAELETQVSSDCIIATNTSSLRLSDMVSAFKQPERFVGLHFFNPVHKMPLVEVITLPSSDPKAVARSVNFVRSIGKTPVVVKDGPGFLVNRLLLPWLNEAGHCLKEGMRIEFMDKALKRFGMPMGPCELLDEIGLDVAAKVSHILHASLGERFKPSDVIDKIIESTKKQKESNPSSTLRFGRKTGLGFYQWSGPAGRRGEIDQSAIDAIVFASGSSQTSSLNADDLVKRMVYPMINEAALILEEGLVASPSHVDVGMIFGTGFPPFRGGLLRYADSIGLKNIVADLEKMQTTVGVRMQPSEALKKFANQKGSFYV